jgi:uncharacterized protein YutE (UPF0331/DUF86 family)
VEYVAILESVNVNCVNRLKNDKIYRGAVLYYLSMTADSCVALAEMLVEFKNFHQPQNASEPVAILIERQILPANFAAEFARLAGWRKFLAPDDEIDDEEICQILLDELEPVKKYVTLIKSHL